MSFGNQMKKRREELGLSRQLLAERLGVSTSAISNYENGVSFPKEEVMLRLFDALETEPNQLFKDHFQKGSTVLSYLESGLLRQYRSLPPTGQELARTMVRGLCACQSEWRMAGFAGVRRLIPLYRSLDAVSCAVPVLGKDFDNLPVTDGVPQTAEFAVRMQGDSMAPFLAEGTVAYVRREPLTAGDVGIFWVDGNMLCRQYDRNDAGTVYLHALNPADADVELPADGSRKLVCFGRVLFSAPSLTVEE